VRGFITVKFAVMLLGTSIVTVKGLSVLLTSPVQLVNVNPVLKVAVSATPVFASYQLEVGNAVPPTTGKMGRTEIVR
jgi:hypothetical protein